MIRFTCGCSSLIELPIPVAESEKRAEVEISKAKYLSTFDAVTFDDEGFIICAIHRQRRLGWRSVPYTATTMPMPGTGAWTELQYEAWLLWREVPKKVEIEIPFSTVSDRRDNSDPTEIGNRILSNG